MKMNRRDFLKWGAGLVALFTWVCKGKKVSQRSVGAKPPRVGRVHYSDTVLRSCGVSGRVQVEVWNGKPIGVRGPATAELLDLTPLFWTTSRIPFPLLHGQRVDYYQVELWLQERLVAGPLGKPWWLVVPPVTSVGVWVLLQEGVKRQLWEWSVESGPDGEWNDGLAHVNRMQSGGYAGMMWLGIHSPCPWHPELKRSWEQAPCRVAMAFAKNGWTDTAHLVWPMPHPFATWDRHVLAGGSVVWQRPVVSEERVGGWSVLLRVLYPELQSSSSWFDWLDSLNPVPVFTIKGSLQELEMPPSLWLAEARKASLPMQGEPLLDRVPASIPKTQGQVRWGMVVDLDRCVGCDVCTLACAIENNVPVVGPQEFSKDRGMHWLRVSQGIPLMCQHCALAPCEAACPVRATTHSHDGLNEQTYARCIGARYCAIHCPWKTRRFGFGVLVDQGGAQLAFNPRVPLRKQGVMEKCTFCVQRLRESSGDSEPVSACAEACPQGALHFGDWNNPRSAVRLAVQGRTLWRLKSMGEEDPSVLYMQEVGG